MRTTQRYWLSLLFLFMVSFAGTLLLIKPDPSSPMRTVRQSDRAPLLREGGYSNAQVTAVLERMMAGCQLTPTDEARDAAEDILLGMSSGYALRPVAVLEKMHCEKSSEGLEGFRRAANRAASDLVSQR